jgi:hypothetical protein
MPTFGHVVVDAGSARRPEPPPGDLAETLS